MSSGKKVVIIGAGISGLTTAYWLSKNNFDVTVLEKSSHIGGSIITKKIDAFLIDLGPNSTLETSDILKDLINEIGLQDEKIYANEASKNRYVLKDGKLYPIPMSLGNFLKTPLFSISAKLRLLKEPFIKPTNGEDISLADFVKHRLGKEFLDYAINPFVAGVYAGDPETLSTAAAFPKLHALEQKYGSFIKGAIMGARERKKSKEAAKNRAKLFSFKNGMQTFTDTLAGLLKGKIETNIVINNIEKNNSGFMVKAEIKEQIKETQFDQLVFCAPTHAMSRLLKNLHPENAKSLENIQYPPVTVVFNGFKKSDIKRDLDGFGFLIPKVENKEILGSIWSSVIFPERSAADYEAFTTFVGGTRQPQNAKLKDDILKKLVYEDLNSIIGLKAEPVFTHIKRWEKSIPQYTLGYKKYQKMFDEMENTINGLYFAGNFRRGISVGDSVLSAHETVEKMVK